MAHDLELTLMLADYHRTRPLLGGEIAAEGITLQPRARRDRRSMPAACVRGIRHRRDVAFVVHDGALQE